MRVNPYYLEGGLILRTLLQLPPSVPRVHPNHFQPPFSEPYPLPMASATRRARQLGHNACTAPDMTSKKGLVHARSRGMMFRKLRLYISSYSRTNVIPATCPSISDQRYSICIVHLPGRHRPSDPSCPMLPPPGDRGFRSNFCCYPDV